MYKSTVHIFSVKKGPLVDKNETSIQHIHVGGTDLRGFAIRIAVKWLCDLRTAPTKLHDLPEGTIRAWIDVIPSRIRLC